jgi:hypothetical protein
MLWFLYVQVHGVGGCCLLIVVALKSIGFDRTSYESTNRPVHVSIGSIQFIDRLRSISQFHRFDRPTHTTQTTTTTTHAPRIAIQHGHARHRVDGAIDQRVQGLLVPGLATLLLLLLLLQLLPRLLALGGREGRGRRQPPVVRGGNYGQEWGGREGAGAVAAAAVLVVAAPLLVCWGVEQGVLGEGWWLVGCCGSWLRGGTDQRSNRSIWHLSIDAFLFLHLSRFDVSTDYKHAPAASWCAGEAIVFGGVPVCLVA